MLPVDVAQIEALGSAVRQLFKITLAEHKRIIDFFARANQPLGQRLVQFVYGALDVFCGEFVGNARVCKLIQFIQLCAENITEKNVVPAAALGRAILGGNVGVAEFTEEFYGGIFAGVIFEI